MTFTFFQNVFHLPFGDKSIIRFKAANSVQCIGQLVSCVKWNKTLFLYIGEIHCSQFIQDCLVAEGISQISFEVTIYYQRKKTDKSRTSNMHFGMGLYITNSIIKQHGGQLVLSNSKKTGGAQVIIKIPY